MIQIGNKDTNYGNWVPAAMMKTCSVGIAVIALLTAVCAVWGFTIPAVILGVLLVVVVIFTLYMKKCRDIFDFNKGGMMGKVHQHLVDHMKWDGNVEKETFIPKFVTAPWMIKGVGLIYGKK